METEATTNVAATTTTAEASTTEAAAASAPKPTVGLMGLAEVAFAVEARASPQPEEDNKSLPLKRVNKFSDKKLLATFSELIKDSKSKHLAYKCHLQAGGSCEQVFESAEGDKEGIAKLMSQHLKTHLNQLEQASADIKLEPMQKKKRTLKKTTTATKSYPSVGESTPQKEATPAVAPSSAPAASLTPPEKKSPMTMVLAKKTPVKGNGNDAAQVAPPPPPPTQPFNIVAAAMDAANILVNQDGEIEDKNAKDYANTIGELQQMSATMKQEADDAQQTMLLSQQSLMVPVMTPVVIETSEAGEQAMSIMSGMAGTAATSSNIVSTVASRMVTKPAAVEAVKDDPESMRMRALALDYIDDIRKKSSSAAKSVIVNGDKSLIYECKLCPDKQFTSTNGLIFHYKKHAGLKPYICELCSSTFTRQHSLNYHMLIHYNKSRFVCKECGRHFRHPSHFKEHMRRHTGETPFQCSDCLIRFKTRNTYKRHLQTKHSKILTSKGIVQLTGAATATGAAGQAVAQKASKTAAATTTYFETATAPAKATKAKGASKKKMALEQAQPQMVMTSMGVTQQQQQTVIQTAPGTLQATSIQQPALVQIDANGTVFLNDPSLLGAQFIPHITQDGQSITIVNMSNISTLQAGTTLQHLPQTIGGANLVRIQKPLGDLTDNVYNQQQTFTILPYTTNATNTATLVSDANMAANLGVICSDGNMLLEPVKSIHVDASGNMVSTHVTPGGTAHALQPTILAVTSATNSDENSTNQLTQLTTAISPQMAVSAAYQTPQVVVATASGAQIPQASQITMANGQPATNYNFMRLLEAIELSEVDG